MKVYISIIALLFFNSVCSAQFLDEISVKLHEPSDLKKDVWLVQTLLEKEDPNLYLYISKKELDHKFDSLRNSINQPLTSIGLYVKLLSVISTIGDGHLTVLIDYSKLTASDIASLKKPVMQHPIYQFEYHVIDKRLFIRNNLTKDAAIAKGTEILSINGMATSKLIDSLDHYITSDGYNITYKRYLMNVGLFAERYRFVFPKKEPLRLELSAKSGPQQVVLNAVQNVLYDSISLAPVPHAEYKRLATDSSVAYLKVRTFMNGANYVGYHGIFEDIEKRKLNTLILDLRGNTGGESDWAASIFSHLIDTPTYFFKPPEVIRKQEQLQGRSNIRDWLKAASKSKWPIVTPYTTKFKGKVYVLINGGSFSAASLLAANMRSLNNVTFVGEETGGSKNILTAGVIKNRTLPNSKLLLTWGIVPAFYGDITTVDGRGVMPDVSITYTIKDYLAEKDLELDWVLKDIEKHKIE
ncbi:MAG: S41 family peptidase [Bacteroidota bacterium]